jgi:hypothetical protein
MIKGNVGANLYFDRGRSAANGWAMSLVNDLTQIAKAQAQRNVAPGVGPGPHPHISDHVDTGELMEDIDAESRFSGNKAQAAVWTSLDYGMFLELGYHTLAGNFIRYPWLEPALDEAMRQLDSLAVNLGQAYFGGSGSRAGGQFAGLERSIILEGFDHSVAGMIQ